MNFRSQASEIAVWWMRVDTPAEAVQALWKDCLDEREKIRADRFRFVEDRTAYIAAHWLVRQALTQADRSGGLPAGTARSIGPEAWRFAQETQGKPVIDPALGRNELQFNISHTKGLVACVVGRGARVGIDVEVSSGRQSGLEIAWRFFSPSEAEILRKLDQDEQIQAFFRLWTLKEAFIKATGEGLYRALDSFSFTLDPVSISFPAQGAEAAAGWEFIEKRPTDEHFMALAIGSPIGQHSRLSIRQVSSKMEAAVMPFEDHSAPT